VVGKNKRFFIPQHQSRLQAQIPVQYMAVSPEIRNEKIKQVAIGMGQKFDFTKNKEAESHPGPGKHNHHIKDSISYKSNKLPKQTNGFYHKYDKYEKICHKGMEQHFYLRES